MVLKSGHSRQTRPTLGQVPKKFKPSSDRCCLAKSFDHIFQKNSETQASCHQSTSHYNAYDIIMTSSGLFSGTCQSFFRTTEDSPTGWAPLPVTGLTFMQNVERMEDSVSLIKKTFHSWPYIKRFLCPQHRTFFFFFFFSKIETRLQQHDILNMKQAETFPRPRSGLHSCTDFTTKLSISARCHSEAHWEKAPKNSAVGRGNFFSFLSRLRVFMHQHHCQDDDWGCINKHPHAHFHHSNGVQRRGFPQCF